MPENTNKDEAMEANQKMSEKFKDFGARETTPSNSGAEWANQEIQHQFYGNSQEDNLSPIHVDVNNPPIKK
ncbi:hypothetical protein HPT25_16445 [Bacillus sp. BRMEA1]|uniref:hypothetical protein n=1 Tax=Neobacillus endophyticus TaxID=2738405 RepID=UPI001566249B|nr:hypothetical protein [Neobacillus endophyticus]NRD78955.1 hypothetical protein [Neobacillus endophyticus]